MAEDSGTNTALVVLVVVLIAALFAVFFMWRGGGGEPDAELKIDLPDEGGGGSLIVPDRARRLAALPEGFSLAMHA